MDPIWTRDAYEQILEDNVLRNDPSLLTFEDLDIQPVSIDKEAFDFLHVYRQGGHFEFVEGYHSELNK